MGDGPRGIQVFPDHFQSSTSVVETPQTRSSSISRAKIEFELSSSNHLWARRRFRSAASMLSLFNLRRLSWGADPDVQKKVDTVQHSSTQFDILIYIFSKNFCYCVGQLVLSAAEAESLRSELADLEEREAHLKARLEHIDEILRSARLSGYLLMRTRWTALPGEPAPLDDTEVDDWLPCFVVLQGPCIFLYFMSTGRMPCLTQEEGQTRYSFYIVTRHGLRYECSSASKLQVDAWLMTLQEECKTGPDSSTIDNSPEICNNNLCQISASRAATSLLSSTSKHKHHVVSGRTVASAATVSFKGTLPALASIKRDNTGNTWIAGALALPAAAYMLQDQEANAIQMERTFIAIKPDGVQRGLISEIIARFECKGFKLVAIKLVVPSKSFAQKHYHDLKERPFFNGLCNFLSSGPVLAMVWEGEGVIRYGRKLIGATDPSKSEPGTIRGDLAIVVGRNIIHGSDGPETAKDEISLWFKPEELSNYTSNQEKWVYGVN
ncbi:Nucleoside diphosphate kinase [Cynara cardunculus var. scolymus]|uniref:Nucleoside diphosphate kinase n=1 Tax=Cynara cardunculus var. scolymus TaxID=59895 RepID=A0A103XJG5_CYNCS|nr:Nucleoside diphosphate kinase [Cynara cardunculus var. scolymus]